MKAKALSGLSERGNLVFTRLSCPTDRNKFQAHLQRISFHCSLVHDHLGPGGVQREHL